MTASDSAAAMSFHGTSRGGTLSATAGRFGDRSMVVRARDGRSILDLGRNVHALFGLVFDAISLDEAALHLLACAAQGLPCFLSTPNLNFAIGTQTDSSFRGSVLRSDLSVADGMPIVWAARWMGLPIRERVAGSDLFERLAARPLAPGSAPVKVYFFGGPDGAAQRAATELNRTTGSLCCVGFESPGFVSIDAMSQPDQIDRINASGADFVVVALGAQKGQAWIERNRERLSAPLVSHLGAVINFVAGSLRRAPIWMQKAGVEWIWRIREEPALLRRYLRDGRAGLRLVLAQVLLWPVLRRLHAVRYQVDGPTSFTASRQRNVTVIHLLGRWVGATLEPLRREVAQRLNDGEQVQFDLAGAIEIDSAFLGLLLLVDGWQAQSYALVANGVINSAVFAAFRAHGALRLLDAPRLPC